jgi:hypothetical protein
MTVPFGHWPGHHIPNTVVPIGAVSGAPSAHDPGPTLSTEQAAALRARRQEATEEWHRNLAAFRAAKQEELEHVRDPIERLFRAAVSCCDVYSADDSPAIELVWDLEKLARYFPDLAQTHKFDVPNRGVGAWRDSQAIDWFLEHVPVSSSRQVAVWSRNRIGIKKENYYRGWFFTCGSRGRTGMSLYRGREAYRSLVVLTDGRMAYQLDTRNAMALWSMDDLDGINGIALREMAKLCGISDPIDEPKNPDRPPDGRRPEHLPANT